MPSLRHDLWRMERSLKMATKTKRPRRKRTGRVAAPRPAPALTKPDAAPSASKLPSHVQLAVVQRLAMFDTPQQVAESVKEEYGIEITRQSVQHYDPTVGDKPAETWCKIFADTRKKFLETQAEIPIANKSVRLRRLERMALAAERQRNIGLTAQLHEQAAKEVGELYTNRHKMELTGKDGEPIEVKTDDLRTKIAGRIAGVASRIGANSNHIGANARGVGGA
jgi:hypothetical protein